MSRLGLEVVEGQCSDVKRCSCPSALWRTDDTSYPWSLKPWSLCLWWSFVGQILGKSVPDEMKHISAKCLENWRELSSACSFMYLLNILSKTALYYIQKRYIQCSSCNFRDIYVLAISVFLSLFLLEMIYE